MAPPKYTAVGRLDIKGRLLTPEEGCGYSVAAHDRQFGRVTAKNGEKFNIIILAYISLTLVFNLYDSGAWPWVVLLGRALRTSSFFKCGKHFFNCFVRQFGIDMTSKTTFIYLVLQISGYFNNI